MFQSETSEIQNLYTQMERLIKIVMNIENVYLGIYAKNLITKLNKNEMDDDDNCINFYIELCDQVFKRFDFGDQYKSLRAINPNFVINGELDSIFEITKHFPNFVSEEGMQNIDTEFRELKLLDFNSIINKSEMDLLSFWKQICIRKSTIKNY
ncbi:hypothetical protein FF38_14255 [Lucilia cuprina]|uniref:Uncharacterized protein n=1 Tax=Lucilia cuprina TaxID=7375 RepID=A0A0L0CR44_LUCCU|nr:hypothetical protein FF38_14255 [Lucilia cuprina]